MAEAIQMLFGKIRDNPIKVVLPGGMGVPAPSCPSNPSRCPPPKDLNKAIPSKDKERSTSPRRTIS